MMRKANVTDINRSLAEMTADLDTKACTVTVSEKIESLERDFKTSSRSEIRQLLETKAEVKTNRHRQPQ